MVEEIHLNDIGTKFLLTIKDGTTAEDISGATTKEIIFQKPDGTSITKSGIFETDGTDGKIYCTSVAGDLDQTGTWTLQAKVVIASGTYHSSISSFKVYSNVS